MTKQYFLVPVNADNRRVKKGFSHSSATDLISVWNITVFSGGKILILGFSFEKSLAGVSGNNAVQ